MIAATVPLVTLVAESVAAAVGPLQRRIATLLSDVQKHDDAMEDLDDSIATHSAQLNSLNECVHDTPRLLVDFHKLTGRVLVLEGTVASMHHAFYGSAQDDDSMDDEEDEDDDGGSGGGGSDDDDAADDDDDADGGGGGDNGMHNAEDPNAGGVGSGRFSRVHSSDYDSDSDDDAVLVGHDTHGTDAAATALSACSTVCILLPAPQTCAARGECCGGGNVSRGIINTGPPHSTNHGSLTLAATCAPTTGPHLPITLVKTDSPLQDLLAQNANL